MNPAAILLVFGAAAVSAFGQNGSFIGMAQCSNQSTTPMTVHQCEQVCGIGWHPYEKWEVINAITTWVIPLFMLVGNMHFSNYKLALFNLSSPEPVPGSGLAAFSASVWSVLLNYTFVICHLLGNPIDVLWSHLEKLEHMHQVMEDTPLLGDDLEPRDIAALEIIFIALDDFNFDDDSPSTIIKNHITDLKGEERAAFLKVCRYSACLLAHTRTSSTRRAALAVIAYIVALYTSLTSAMAQDAIAVHTPHTLALRELYYWLITAIVFSSATGAFPTDSTARAALNPIITAVGDPPLTLAEINSFKGGNYGYRPQKRLSTRSAPLLVIAVLAVGGAWAISFSMSWVTPTRGLGCRSFMELGFFLAWVVNFVLSYCVTSVTPPRHLHGVITFAIVCDMIVAVPSICCLFLAFKGWFNSCRCWATIWTPFFSGKDHYVPVGLAAQERDLAPTYFGLIGCALGLQAAISASVLIYYRRELRLIYGGQALEVWIPPSQPQQPQNENGNDASETEMENIDTTRTDPGIESDSSRSTSQQQFPAPDRSPDSATGVRGGTGLG